MQKTKEKSPPTKALRRRLWLPEPLPPTIYLSLDVDVGMDAPSKL